MVPVEVPGKTHEAGSLWPAKPPATHPGSSTAGGGQHNEGPKEERVILGFGREGVQRRVG